MSGRYPEIVCIEEGMREGMQIEDAHLPIDAKVALLDALSTGLKRIVGGSFVSPRYTPQMAREGAIHPWKESITSPYRERVAQGLPPFAVDGDWPGMRHSSPGRLP